VFDNQIIAQAVAAGARIGEVSCPTRYQDDASSINLPRSVKYGLGVLATSAQYRIHKLGWRRFYYLDINRHDVARPAAPKPAGDEVSGDPEKAAR
jgi:hypothetical protein